MTTSEDRLATAQASLPRRCRLVRLTDDARSSTCRLQMIRDLRRLGGVVTRWGYIFENERRRGVALDILADKYGARYFQAVDRSP